MDSLPTAAVDRLLALSDAATRATRPDDLLQEILVAAADLTALPWGALMLRDPDSGDLWLVATHGVPMSELPPVLQLPRTTHINPALFTGAPLVLEDYTGGAPLSPVWWEPAARLGLRTIVAVPLPGATKDGGAEYIGSLHVAGPAPHRFPPIEVALLQRLARLAGQVLVHTGALSAAERRAGALQTMQAVARSLDVTLDLDTVLALLLERAVELAGGTGGVLMLWEAEAERLVVRKAVNAAEFVQMRITPEEGVSGVAFSTGQPHWQNSYQYFEGALVEPRQERVTNVLAVPLLREGRAFGTITVYSRVFKPFTPEDAEMLSLFASQAAVAIDNQTLYSTRAQMEHSRAELQIARQQEDFLSIASHELRTPVTAIKGFADLLARRLAPGDSLSDRDASMVRSIAAQARRLAGLIDDLLDVGHLRSGNVAFRYEPCSLTTVLQAALNSVRALAGARENDLRLAGDDVCVLGDAARLEQVFVNLLTNALKYSTAGPITATIRRAGDQVCVGVADEGKGIAPEDLPHIFDRFFRSHDVYAHQRGIGLGLYISRQIVERHQGRLWAESRVGEGSTFYVELPIAAPSP